MIRPDFREISCSEIYHYGIPERSGRYKWGSGDRPYQRLEDGRAGNMSDRKINKNIKKVKKYAYKGMKKSLEKIDAINSFNDFVTRGDFISAEYHRQRSMQLDDKIEKYLSKSESLFKELRDAGISLDIDIVPVTKKNGKLDYIVKVDEVKK